MISRLYIENGFRHHEVEFLFDRGLTAITGANECGKSLLLEFIRYALFGTQALRGSAEDYKKLLVELDFSVRGVPYRSLRHGSKATLSRNGEIIAAGHKVLNIKIPEIFSYGLTVFDTANAANQGEIEKLGTMKPAERKRMVDNIIGLNTIDNVIDWLASEAALVNKELEIVKTGLVEPALPVKPEGYETSGALRLKSIDLLKLKSEKDQISGWLSNEPTLPAEPTCAIAETTVDLQTYFDDFHKTNRKILDLSVLFNGIAVPTYTEEQLAALEEQHKAYGTWTVYSALLSRVPAVPELTTREAQDIISSWDQFRLWVQKKVLLDQGNNTCPKCEHEWPIACEHLAKYDNVSEVPQPRVTERKAVQIIADNEAYERAVKGLEPFGSPEEVAEPALSIPEIKAQRALLARQGERQQLAEQILTLHQQLEGKCDRAADLATRRQFEASYTAWQATRQDYDRYQLWKPEKLKRFEELGQVEGQLTIVNTRLVEAQAYETNLKVYQTQKERYDAAKVRVGELETDADQHARAKKGLQALKGKVKQHLVPSLNRVASLLLTQMTGGKRNDINIDEDFNVLVDGQEMNTLSGSGKAVANLAIRIGLGQVLTNKVFSVFMADEIDAAMDAERAGFTAECLQRLTSNINQIILVSHKRPEADHYIELAA